MLFCECCDSTDQVFTLVWPNEQVDFKMAINFVKNDFFFKCFEKENLGNHNWNSKTWQESWEVNLCRNSTSGFIKKWGDPGA